MEESKKILHQGYLSRGNSIKGKQENAAHSGFYVLTRGTLDFYKSEKMVIIYFEC